MELPKLSKAQDGKAMHFSVGGVIKKNGKYLLMDRMKPPFGFACTAGHVYENEDIKTALRRVVQDETGLKVTNQTLLFEEEVNWNWCKEFIWAHYWYIYECEVEGDPNRNLTETRSLEWYSPEQLKKLKLEKVWDYWFTKMDVLK